MTRMAEAYLSDRRLNEADVAAASTSSLLTYRCRRWSPSVGRRLTPSINAQCSKLKAQSSKLKAQNSRLMR